MIRWVGLLLALMASPTQAQDRVYRQGFETPCTHLPSPLRSTLQQTYSSYYGVAFGQQHVWAANYITNVDVIAPPSVQSIGVHSYSFPAPPAAQTGTLRTPSTPYGVVFAISDQCGVFDVPPACIMITSSILLWSTETNPSVGKCALTPGQPYFMNVAYFNYPIYLSNAGSLQSTCVANPNCNSQTCSYQCNYQHMASQP